MSKLQMFDAWKARGLKVLDTGNPRGLPSPKTYRAKQDNGRTLTLDGAKWRKLRRYILQGEPLCRHCTARGLTVVATDVDHRDNDASNNDPVNLQPLCHACHSRKTASDMGRRVSMGCSTDGTPLDAGHHWNKSPATVGHIPIASSCFNPKSEVDYENQP